MQPRPVDRVFSRRQVQYVWRGHGDAHRLCRSDRRVLEFSRLAGNDLSTPMPQYRFPGLQPGDRWCVCLPRWLEALEAGVAPKLVLKATHLSAIEHIDLEILYAYGVDAPEQAD
jgi:uncharacterized protein